MRFEQQAMELDHAICDLTKKYREIDRLHQHIKDTIRSQIQFIQPYYLQRSLQKFLIHEKSFSSSMDALQRRLSVSDEIRAHLASLMGCAQDIGWPGMIVRPGNEDWARSFCTDPIYALDYTPEQIASGIQCFNSVVQNRICRYTINETPGQPIMPFMPNGQIGISVLYYFLEFRPMEIIQQWLDELWRITRPGGRVMFTYNDCDYKQGVMLYEDNFMSYTPGHMIKKHACLLGFEIVEHYRPTDSLSLLHLKKPGELFHSRASQTLARVLARPK